LRHSVTSAEQKSRVERIVLIADLLGTAVFAVEGAIAAMLAGAACLLLRLLSVHFGWQLPKVMGA
jgi:uncharacterized membrane protein YeiH